MKVVKSITIKALKIKIIAIVIVILLLSLLIIGSISSLLTTSLSSSNVDTLGATKQLAPEVLKWKATVEKYAKKYGISEFVPYLLAIIQVETGGTSHDLMQSSESAGMPVNTLSYVASIDQGCKSFSSIYNFANANGRSNDIDAILQSYNYGIAYIKFLVKNNKKHSTSVSEEYSKNVVAKSLGNTSGKTYPYVNEISTEYGKQFLYVNGGNFYYSQLVEQYSGSSSNGNYTAVNPAKFYSKMKKEMEKYQGQKYVFGGKSPETGFDCSGLTSYLYKTCAGISIESYTVSQYNSSVKVSLSEAQAGDLIFFRGTYGSPDFISHVGIYVNQNTMFDSDSQGVGYHSWKSSYWMSHSPEIRRVKK